MPTEPKMWYVTTLTGEAFTVSVYPGKDCVFIHDGRTEHGLRLDLVSAAYLGAALQAAATS